MHPDRIGGMDPRIIIDSARKLREAERVRVAILDGPAERFDAEPTVDSAMDFLNASQEGHTRFNEVMGTVRAQFISEAIGFDPREIQRHLMEGNLDGIALNEVTGEIAGVKDGEMVPLDGLGKSDPDTTPSGDATIPGIDMDSLRSDDDADPFDPRGEG
jgi:hypothetical protein